MPLCKAWTRGDSIAELSARLARAQSKMRDNMIDALLLTTEANVRYFTGYHSPFWHSPTRPWFVVVPSTGQPVAVIPTIGEDAFNRNGFVDVVTWPAPRPEDDGISDLVRVLTNITGPSGQIGAELGPEMVVRMPIQDFDQLRMTLTHHNLTIVDAGLLLQQMRVIKSTSEIAKVEVACQAMSAAHREIPATIHAGMTEIQACKAIKRLFLLHGADDTPYVICRSGPVSYSDIIGHPTERILTPGDMLVVDSGCQVDGYFCDYNRNYAVDQPEQRVAAAYSAVNKATDAALKAVRPGVAFRDIYAAMSDAMGVQAEGGVGRMGHSVGLQLTEWPSIHPSETTLLEEGMVLAIEPSIPVEDGNGAFVVTEEEVVVTSDGYRLLSERAPSVIPVVQGNATCKV